MWTAPCSSSSGASPSRSIVGVALAGCSACRPSCRRRRRGAARSGRRARRAGRTAAPPCTRRCSPRRPRRRRGARSPARGIARLHSLERDARPLGAAPGRRHDAELAREVDDCRSRRGSGRSGRRACPTRRSRRPSSRAPWARTPADPGAAVRALHPPGPATWSPSTSGAAGRPSSNRRSGKASPAARMNSCTAATPRAGSGSAGSAHTTSSVTRSAIAPASWLFHEAT